MAAVTVAETVPGTGEVKMTAALASLTHFTTCTGYHRRCDSTNPREISPPHSPAIQVERVLAINGLESLSGGRRRNGPREPGNWASLTKDSPKSWLVCQIISTEERHIISKATAECANVVAIFADARICD
jgi:hypothetical protein